MAAGLSLLQFNPALLTEFAVQPESDRLGETTALVVELEVGIEIPCLADRSGCSVVVSSPVRNPYTSSIERETFFEEGQVSCKVSIEVSNQFSLNLLAIFNQNILHLRLNNLTKILSVNYKDNS